MKKLLIAVNSDVVSQDLKSRLDCQLDILCCHNGIDAVSILNDFRPDLLVIDLMLSQLDGITVLKAASGAGIFPKVIALSDYVSDFVFNAMSRLNVSALFRYSSDMCAVASHIMDLSDEQPMQYTIQHRIRDTIALLGFNMNSSSTSITVTAIEFYMKNPKQKLSATLYPDIAQLYSTNPKQVERAIRLSIEGAWLRRREELWRLYFAIGKNGKVSKPTNSDFLARVSRCVEYIGNLYEQAQNRIEKIG